MSLRRAGSAGKLGPVKRQAPLDGLRGLAVGLVLASHSSNAGFDIAPGFDARGVGRAGVFLFFVLSSYLLTAQCLEAPLPRPASWWGRFGARRLLRILPAYALTLGLYVALGAFTQRVAFQHLCLVRAEAHFWTIPVEALFYLSLPLIGFGLGRIRGTAARLFVLALVGGLVRWVWPPDYPARPPSFRPNVAPFLPVFLVGSALAVLRPWLQTLGGRALRWLDVFGWAALAGVALLTPAVWERLTAAPVHHTRFHLWFDVYGVLFGLVVLATIPPGGGSLARVFCARPLAWLGLVSYSVYLLHALAFSFAQARVGSAVWVGPLSMLAAIGAGTLSYALVERPFLGLLRARPRA